jgi:hypothetical protein
MSSYSPSVADAKLPVNNDEPMKQSIKTLCLAPLMAAALTACGGGGNSGSAVATDDPVIPVQPNTPRNPGDPQVPQEEAPGSEDPQQDSQEPQELPLPLEGQTGWSFYGVMDTRKPLEMLKALFCSQLATAHEEVPPQSSEACDVRFPGMQSGVEESLSIFEDMPPGTELVKREGCTWVPAEQGLACSWTYTGPSDRSTTGYFRASIALPFMPSFRLELDNCAADQPYYFSFDFGRGAQGSAGRVAKDIDIPFGCVSWAGTTDFFGHTETGIEFDEVPAP